MTDREKIVELLEQIDAVSYERSKTETGFMIIKRGKEYIADYLISHGVTVKEMQKPITKGLLPENSPCWFEVKNMFGSLPLEPIKITKNTREIYCLYFIGEEDSTLMDYDLYGKTWRCWAEKPTDEERRNAKWEE